MPENNPKLSKQELVANACAHRVPGSTECSLYGAERRTDSGECYPVIASLGIEVTRISDSSDGSPRYLEPKSQRVSGPDEIIQEHLCSDFQYKDPRRT